MKSRANKFLDSRALLRGAALVGDVLSTLEAARPKPPSGRRPAPSDGVSGILFWPEWAEYESQFSDWRRDARVSVKLLNRHQDIKFLTTTREYEGLCEGLKIQAYRRGHVFSDPLAQLWMLEAVLLALFERALFKMKRRIPITACAQDFRQVENVLRHLERVAARGAVCADMVATLKADVKSRRAFARKPHADRFAIDRHACHIFTKYLFIHFKGTIPPALVKRFGNLIQYSADDLVANALTQWIAGLDAGHLDIPTPGVF